MITSNTNKLVKLIKSLSKKKHRYTEQKYIIEGSRSVRDVLISNKNIDTIAYSSDFKSQKESEEIFDLIKNLNLKAFEVENKLFKQIAETENTQGIIAILNMNANKISDLSEEDKFILMLDRVQDPGNMGTMLRTAEALGAEAIIISKGSVDVYSPKASRASMGAITRLKIIFEEDSLETLKELKRRNITVVSTSPHTEKYVSDIDFNKKFVIIIGNEANGVSDEILNSSDEIVKIPMKKNTESFNAAVAASIVMYEAARQIKAIY